MLADFPPCTNWERITTALAVQHIETPTDIQHIDILLIMVTIYHSLLMYGISSVHLMFLLGDHPISPWHHGSAGVKRRGEGSRTQSRWGDLDVSPAGYSKALGPPVM